VHGLLHVLGHDHETPGTRRGMLRRQERYLKRFGEPATC
jgi:ssRNA-specific RNase YbeY (16S rRNA maturation enzyme)